MGSSVHPTASSRPARSSLLGHALHWLHSVVQWYTSLLFWVAGVVAGVVAGYVYGVRKYAATVLGDAFTAVTGRPAPAPVRAAQVAPDPADVVSHLGVGHGATHKGGAPPTPAHPPTPDTTSTTATPITSYASKASTANTTPAPAVVATPMH